MKKVTELIQSNTQFSYSFEVTPDVSEREINSLPVDPAFFSITWHAKSHKCKDMNINSLLTASLLASKQKHVLMHLSCDKLKIDYLKQLLVTFQEKNICNLFLILGESYDPECSDFKSTSQLIKFIREHAGNYFCIGVAGFPDCSDEKLLHLKEKIISGADFIITQAFFDFNTFKAFKNRCEQIHITVPIIPGVFRFESFKQLTAFINICKVKVSSDLLAIVKNEEDLTNSGSNLVELLINKLQTELNIRHFHFFTLNKLRSHNEFIQNGCFTGTN